MRPRNVIAFLLLCGVSTRAGEITGTVRLAGHPPRLAWREVVHDTEVCGETARPATSLLLGTNQTVRDVIIYLGAGPTNSRPLTPVTLDQRGCDFVPRVQIAASGAPLIVRNSDPTLHVVRIDSMSGTNELKTLLTVAAPYAGFEKRFQLANFREPTLLKAMNANGHDWMAAYLAVMPHPWAALTDGEGRFTLHDVPAGTHKLYAWHEALGTLVREVKITGDGATTVSLEFSATR